MPRFFTDSPLQAGQSLPLSDTVVRHIHVLRLREQEEIVLFNGNGSAYSARLTAIGKRTAEAEILAEMPSENESPLHITLIQAVSSGERMDFTIQKSVELGVNEIIPVQAERSVVKLSGERADKRVQRWQEIVISACEQCGRNTVPRVQPLQTLKQAFAALPDNGSLKLLMGLNHAQKLSQFGQPQRIVFMVGPEGGWTDTEEAAAFAAGFQSVLLGGRVLRTETASLAGIAAMQTLWGDFV
ncbi:MAG: 16S rRNA (uracil(1498)-N(3))-methyltransferase [Neisseria sp.]|nr:16S rRNA (uracil(1498)-N(3))-methyltransferase [Neisseria sp.]